MADNINNTNTGGAQAAPSPAPKGARVQKWSTGKTVAVALAIAFAVVLVAAAGVGVYGAYFYGNLYPGVSVDGASLGGMTRQQALDKVTAIYAGRSSAQSFRITLGEQTFPIDITSDDMGYDAAKTAEEAYLYGRSGGFFTRISQILKALRGGVDITPTYMLNEQRIAQKAQAIAQEANRGIVDASYSFDGSRLIVDRGQAGASVDEEELTAFIIGKLTGGDFADGVFQLSTEEPDALDLLLIKSAIESEMQNPRLDLENDPTGATIIPAKAGVHMDLQKARQALEATDDRYVTIPVDIVEPQYTTQEYQALVFRDVLGECTTDFNAGLVGRTTNVLLANGFCNGVILNPGDVFSYNDTVGPRTYERGFKDAIVYVGTSAEDGVGGGICQVSSTIYYACLRADLEIVERRSHSRMVTYVPLGEDATVAWGATDYRFKNNTDFPIKIVTTNTKNTITIQLLGTQTVPNKVVKMHTNRLSYTPFEIVYVVDPTLPVGTEKVDKTGYSGARTETYRVVYIDGVEVSRTFENKSSYTKYDKVILHNPGTTETTDPNQPTDPNATTQPPATDPTTAMPTGTTQSTDAGGTTTDGTAPQITEPTEPTAVVTEPTEPTLPNP